MRILFYVVCGVIYFYELCKGVSVNMRGTVNIGQDVMTVINSYLRNRLADDDGRRTSLIDPKETDTINFIVKSTFLCQGIKFCETMDNFINEYVIVLADTLENIVLKYLNIEDGVAPKLENYKVSVIASKLKEIMIRFKIELISADHKITEETKSYYWIDVIKKISSKLQDVYVTHVLEINNETVSNNRKNVVQDIVITTVVIEQKYQAKLCTEFRICIKSVEVTSALDNLLIHFEDLSEEKVRDFVGSFNEVLFDTDFYSMLEETVGSEFENLLHEMTNFQNVSVKDTLLNLQRIIEYKLKRNMNEYESKSADVELLNVILSDMDHIYDNGTIDPFFNFFQGFYIWVENGGRLNKLIKAVLKDISRTLSSVEDHLVEKLLREVEVFLDIVLVARNKL